MNIYRDGKSRLLLLLPLLFGGLMCCGAFKTVFALAPDIQLSQYSRDFFGIEKGFSGGTVYAIAQTEDGYLWIGSEKGLFRFDGLKFELIHPENTPLAKVEPVLGLITDAEGNLWIRLRSPKIIRYRDGKYDGNLLNLSEVDPRISTMNRGNKGDLVLSTLENGPLRFSENEIVALVPKSELPGSFLISAAESSSGEVWMGTREAGLYRFDGKEVTAVTANLPDRKINCLLPDENGSVWIGTDRGIARWNGDALVLPDLPESVKNSQILTMIKDRHANLWIGTKADGIIRIDKEGGVAIENDRMPSNKIVTTLFEDREGNIWAGNQSGIERLRENAFITYSLNNGLPSDENGALFVDELMNAWFAPIGGGLFWLKESKIGSVKIEGLAEDVVYSITGNKNDLWVGRQRGGLTYLRLSGREVAASRTYTQSDGLAQNSVYTVFQSRDESIWAGTLSGGVSHLKDGKFTNFTTSDGLAADSINAITESSGGAMWFATSGGLSSFFNNNWHTFTTKDGLPANAVNCLSVNSANRGLWIGTDKGLGFLADNRVRTFSNPLISGEEPIYGLAEDRSGNLWISTANRILRIEIAKLLDQSLTADNISEFGLTDGLIGLEGVKRSQSVRSDNSGRIWFSLNKGISVVDPQRLKERYFPALVHVNYITADGKPVDTQGTIRIGANYQKIAIGFTGLSLSIPERVRYRYKLENFDADWSAPTAGNEAIYTNLSPGHYRFHLIASNSSNIWNKQETIVEFEIEPMFWQTWWFRFFCLMFLLFLVFILFRLREYRITRNLNLRFEERLAERTLIARELHDSLLQGVVGASIQLDVAIDRIPENSSAKQSLSNVLQNMKLVIEEGRNTVRGLRASSGDQITPVYLEESLSDLWRNISGKSKADFRLVVDGTPRPLRPLIFDEIRRIGGEALTNAARHSKADKIEVEIDYAARYFRLSVKDNGCGIDMEIVNNGREGHWGLTGMRERADKIGAKLKLWSLAGSGTEVEVIIPNKIAFKNSSSKNYLLSYLNELRQRKHLRKNEQKADIN